MHSQITASTSFQTRFSSPVGNWISQSRWSFTSSSPSSPSASDVLNHLQFNVNEWRMSQSSRCFDGNCIMPPTISVSSCDTFWFADPSISSDCHLPLLLRLCQRYTQEEEEQQTEVFESEIYLREEEEEEVQPVKGERRRRRFAIIFLSIQLNHLLLLSPLLLFTTRAINRLHEMLQCMFSEQVIAGHANKWVVVVVVCSAQKRVKDHLNISPPIRAVNCYLREQRTAKRLKVRVNRRRRGNLFIQLKRKK